jgi:thioredoxin reductase (NADPH)
MRAEPGIEGGGIARVAERPAECLVIGAGPAGLTAAIYLARFRRAVTVIDAGASRAAWIPVSHNLVGFPHGLSGPDLLARLRAQAAEFGVHTVSGEVTALERDPDGMFAARCADGAVLHAPRLVMATGGLDVEPDLPGVRDAVRRGLVRYCPICDAYEVIDKRVALIAFGKCRIREALLLRSYTADVTVLTLGRAMEIPDNERRALEEAGIAVLETPVSALAVEDGRIAAWHMEDGTKQRFDTIYTALGTRIRSELALRLGAEADVDGALLTDRHQRSSVSGLYAAGDVVSGLSQVSVAAGQAAIAATAVNASLPFPRATPAPR